MNQRRSAFAVTEFYHIYNRGVDKRTIFVDGADHIRFVELLYLSNSTQPVNIRNIREEVDSVFKFDGGEKLVAIGAYCLMPNHFHILVTPLVENGVQTFMRKVSTGYSMYFNKRYERSGVLFQGRYKSERVDSDEYLKYLYSYIHLNPLKLIEKDWKEIGLKNISGAQEYLDDYRFSSYRDYCGSERGEGKILDTTKFPLYFPNRDQFLEEINTWLTYRKFP